jgi:HSP20 family molecular chaperone IbpA
MKEDVMSKHEKEKKEIGVREKETIQPAGGEPTRAGVYYAPAVDIHETDEKITVVADMPGVRKESVEVDIKEGVLTISGTVEQVPERLRPVYREYQIGGYLRRFTIGDKIDSDGISAQMACGVLTLELPKADRLRSRRIEVQAG